MRMQAKRHRIRIGWLTAALSADFVTLTVRVVIAGLPVGAYDASVPVGVGGSSAAGGTLNVTLVIS